MAKSETERERKTNLTQHVPHNRPHFVAFVAALTYLLLYKYVQVLAFINKVHGNYISVQNPQSHVSINTTSKLHKKFAAFSYLVSDICN